MPVARLATCPPNMEADGISTPVHSTGEVGMTSPRPFDTVRAAALAVLNDRADGLTWKAGAFLGQCCVADRGLSEKQRSWLASILARADLPGLSEQAK